VFSLTRTIDGLPYPDKYVLIFDGSQYIEWNVAMCISNITTDGEIRKWIDRDGVPIDTPEFWVDLPIPRFIASERR
jgi:hypothetical protein